MGAFRGIMVRDKYGNLIDLTDQRPKKLILNELMVSRKDAAERLGLTVGQFSSLVREGIFPARAPNSNRWNRKALMERLEDVAILSERVISGYVYFMRMGEFIKIGWSTWPDSRRAELQTSNPYAIIILAAFPGRIDQEGKVHELFKHARHRGEWFKPTPGLLAYIAWQKTFWRTNANVICGDLDNVIRFNGRGESVERAKKEA